MFVGLKAMNSLLGGKGLDSLPADVVCWCQLSCCTHLEMEIENAQLCTEKLNDFHSHNKRSSPRGVFNLTLFMLKLLR
jgi:hypothetical protein